MKIAIIGGTGKLGLGLAARLVQSSHEAAIGSRDVQKAEQAAAGLDERVRGMSNIDAANWCDAAVLTLPYNAHQATLESLREALRLKIVIDATVPLDFNNLFRPATKSGNSAAEETNALLGDAKVFAAFQTISHRILRIVDRVEDVLVAGTSERKDEVLQLLRDLRLRPIDAGPLEAARLLECMTALLLSINKQNKVKEAGLKVTGL
jgi:NADPH-dependent F420 reductase